MAFSPKSPQEDSMAISIKRIGLSPAKVLA
jgi:hypothetical protein